jgi:hypothetical protein
MEAIVDLRVDGTSLVIELRGENEGYRISKLGDTEALVEYINHSPDSSA